MEKNTARHLATWSFTAAFEVAAGIMSQRQEWIIVTALFWLGVASLAVGYIPDLKVRIRSGRIFAWEFLKQSVVAFVMLCAVYFASILGFALVREWSITSPHLFQPEPWAQQNRAFVEETPSQLRRYFKDNTQASAGMLLGRYIGKWYAIAGEVEDITDMDTFLGINKAIILENRTLVSLTHKQNDPIVMLNFSDQWHEKLEVLNKGASISAYCKISAITSSWIRLNECQLASR